MQLKEDFQRRIRDTISQYPAAALLYQVGDPRLLAALDAVATMFGMLSQQLDQDAAEPFIKSRDSTVLADAALRGILPMARSARFRLAVDNPTAAPYTLAAGRRLIDSNGKLCVVETAAVIAAGGTGTVTAKQQLTRTVAVQVAASEPFYSIEIPPSEEGNFIAGLSVVRVSDGQVFAYRPQFCNVAPGELVYTVETDEFRRLFVRFGYQDVVGYQPAVGENFQVVISESSGDIRPAIDSPFTLEYALAPGDADVSVKMEALLEPGTAPMDLPTLRDLLRYPAVYDDNAVFLGNFDFLVRRRLPNLRFLSVWNERIEERVRGASLNSVNKLFFSVIPEDGADQGSTEELIKQVIAGADDSYRFGVVAAVDVPIVIAVEAFVGVQNEVAVVEAQIRESVLAEYGIDTPAAKRGLVMPQYKRFYDRLRKEVPALAEAGSDLRVAITLPPGAALPEQRRYVSDASLAVTITTVQQAPSGWGN